MPLTKLDYQDALYVQSACNLSGIVYSLDKVVIRVREEPDCTGTEFVNKHPIVKMYVWQLCWLSWGVEPNTRDREYTDTLAQINSKLAKFIDEEHEKI